MNYSIIYNKLIDRATTLRDLEYGEWHHIVPVCMGGTDDNTNLVFLTAREHFIAHALLAKIYDKTYFGYKLASAFNQMCQDGQGGRRYTSKMFEVARKMFSRNHPCKREDIKQKIRDKLNENYSNPNVNAAIRQKRNYTYELKGQINYKDGSLIYEKRECACGCGKTFDVLPTDTKKFISHDHATSCPELLKRMGKNVSKSLRVYLLNLSSDEMTSRLEKSLWSCDHIARGTAISKGKKGKSTNQNNIMGERYSKMSDEEFAEFIRDRKPFIQTRMKNLREKTCKK